MILRIKAFIYRLSCILGKRIYLAQKEEHEHFAQILFVHTVTRIITGKDKSDLPIMLQVGMWHADNGFTSVYTRNIPRIEALKQNIIHLFKG